MAVNFNDDFNFDDEPQQCIGATSSDGNTVRSGTGATVTSSTVWDYFNDSPLIDDYIEWKSNKRFKNVTINVGTQMDGSPVFELKYLVGATWIAVPGAYNVDAITKAGVQTIEYTPPKGWAGPTNSRPFYKLRLYITDVTDVTEGGANQTDKPKAGDFGFTITGLAQDILDVRDYAEGTAFTILNPTTSATGLLTMQMPNHISANDDLVDVILSGTTAGAGDTVDLTGIDVDSNALTHKMLNWIHPTIS